VVPNVCAARALQKRLDVAVAVNVTGGSPATVADNEFVPVEPPRVQLPTAANPAELVTGVGPVIDPPPDTTAKVTVTPDFGLPPASFTMTDGGTATEAPAAAL
jgi:hypothetical protein